MTLCKRCGRIPVDDGHVFPMESKVDRSSVIPDGFQAHQDHTDRHWCAGEQCLPLSGFFSSGCVIIENSLERDRSDGCTSLGH